VTDEPRRSPLSGLLPWSAPGGAVSLAEIPFLMQLGLRLGRVADSIAGVRLPLEANRALTTRAVRSLWLGPDEWLLTAAQGATPRLLPALERAVAGRFGAVTDLSAARAAIEVTGPEAGALLATGCSLDLHPRAFAPDQCAETLLAKLPVILDQLDATPRYRLLVRTSSARWLVDWLIDAAQEFFT
jgi:sarcosine oxidase, subunit gamma